MHNILVTGTNGQLGSALRARTIGSTDHWIFTDLAELDITDRQAVHRCLAEHQIDVVVNCAAYTNVEHAEEDKAEAERLNCTAAGILAAAAAETDATLIHISTDYVFAGTAHLPYRELDPVGPQCVYGRTKLAGEQAVAASGAKHLIIRTAWLYSQTGSNFVKTMRHLTASRETLDVVFDQIGTPTYAGDLADTLMHIVREGLYTGNEGTYHFSNEGVCSWYDFACEIARLSGHDRCQIRPCHTSEFPTKAARPAYSVLDKTKIKATFGIHIPHWRESLVHCIEKLKQQQ